MPTGGDAVGPFGEALGRSGDKHGFDVLRVVVDLEGHGARGAFARGKLRLVLRGKHLRLALALGLAVY